MSLSDLNNYNKRPVHAKTWMKLQKIMVNKNKWKTKIQSLYSIIDFFLF